MENPFHKTIITGAGGMVGSYIDFGVVASHADLDITDLGQVLAFCDRHKPKVIIHLAAETDVDLCERDPGHAYLVNTAGTYNMAVAAKQHNALLVYASTAAVFDGMRKKPYAEVDEPNPQHQYGKSKYLGELIVRGMLKKHLIVRAGWMFGGGEARDKKFVGKIIRQLRAGDVNAVDDTIGSPTYAKDFIAAIQVLIQQGKTGTFHLANRGSASRYEIASFIKEVLGFSTNVKAVSSSFFQMDAKRGASEALSSRIHIMRPWRAALKAYLEEEWGTASGYFKRDTCRICGSKELRPVLDLGTMPLANAFLTKHQLAESERKFPLRLFYCASCSLVQLIDVVDPKLLFLHYDYLTSASAPLVEHFERMAETIVNRFSLTKQDLVIEVGSNDGALLAHVKNRVRVLGIDPAEEAASMAKAKGVETVGRFLDSRVAEDVVTKYGHARVVIANNVMAHMDDVRGTFSAVRNLLVPGGRFVFEVHWVGNLIGEGGFDQIYHEHLCYYSLHAIQELLKRTGFSLEDAELVNVHGQSLRVYAYNGRARQLKGARDLLLLEKKQSLNSFRAYRDFARRVAQVKRDLRRLLRQLNAKRLRVVGYGAPAKGNTLLNYCHIGPELVAFITDSTLFKQGKYTPGTHIEIVPPEMLSGRRPDYILLLAWNYSDAILRKEERLRDEGTKFILPVPTVRVV